MVGWWWLLVGLPPFGASKLMVVSTRPFVVVTRDEDGAI